MRKLGQLLPAFRLFPLCSAITCKVSKPSQYLNWYASISMRGLRAEDY
jgi:hypothetical protein